MKTLLAQTNGYSIYKFDTLPKKSAYMITKNKSVYRIHRGLLLDAIKLAKGL